MASLSVFMGLDKGIKRLSEINLGLALVLLLFVFFASSTIFILQATIQNAGQYFSNLFNMTFNLYAYQSDGWIGGMDNHVLGMVDFMVTICRHVYCFVCLKVGTIREFIVGVLLIATGFTPIWMGVMGNAALFSILNEANTSLVSAVQRDSSVALFEFLHTLPFSGVMSFIATILVMLFFVTSADSGALVTDYLTAKSKIRRHGSVCFGLH